MNNFNKGTENFKRFQVYLASPFRRGNCLTFLHLMHPELGKVIQGVGCIDSNISKRTKSARLNFTPQQSTTNCFRECRGGASSCPFLLTCGPRKRLVPRPAFIPRDGAADQFSNISMRCRIRARFEAKPPLVLAYFIGQI